MIVTLEQAKKHLNIDDEFNADDLYITDLIAVAENSILRHLNYKSYAEVAEEGEIPSSVIHANLLLIGNLYLNREPVSYSSVVKIPYTYEYLLSLYMNYTTF